MNTKKQENQEKKFQVKWKYNTKDNEVNLYEL